MLRLLRVFAQFTFFGLSLLVCKIPKQIYFIDSIYLGISVSCVLTSKDPRPLFPLFLFDEGPMFQKPLTTFTKP